MGSSNGLSYSTSRKHKETIEMPLFILSHPSLNVAFVSGMGLRMSDGIPCFFALLRGGIGQAITKSLSINILAMPLHVLTIPKLSQAPAPPSPASFHSSSMIRACNNLQFVIKKLVSPLPMDSSSHQCRM